MSSNIHLKVRRQDAPESTPYWQEFEVPWREGHNVVSVLMALRENPVTNNGERVDPGILGI